MGELVPKQDEQVILLQPHKRAREQPSVLGDLFFLIVRAPEIQSMRSIPILDRNSIISQDKQVPEDTSAFLCLGEAAMPGT